MQRDWIFIGDHNLRGETRTAHRPGGEAPRGELIEPFVPFDCTAEWRATYRKNHRVDRQIMTVGDYEKRLATYTLPQLFNETRRRIITTHPVHIRDAQRMLRPTSVHAEIRECMLAGVQSELARQYGLDQAEIADAVAEAARVRIINGITAYMCKHAGMTEAELRVTLIGHLMAPIRALQDAHDSVSRPEEPAPPLAPPNVYTVDERRAQVRVLLQDGWTQKAMARHLNVSRSTIQLDVAAVQPQEQAHGG
jgi:hypothetical protein